jgi:hypothetical protein
MRGKMSGSLIDANVLLDIATADPTWMVWSQEQIRLAAGRGPLFVNPIIYAELAPAFAAQVDLDRWLNPTVFRRAPCLTTRVGLLHRRLFSTEGAADLGTLHCPISTLARMRKSNN